ncbi:apolipoprotein acyltransferase [Celeribacter sp. PS-C1]|uniref:apolipoprotein acyltransferase n=1 Tax=Celeribacter sp. PS-C1 TaxID=2820813 RepID=UPI001CA53133|nr:apolipoprotein acyltransferase [Celeribacter sp. PS-C1]MBW6417331.1 apolipoprotein acyltransferase [Celeribacter sp. PS-C1]
MIGLVLTLLGGIWGWRLATKRGGDRADRLQYMVVYALLFGIVGLFLGVIFDRMV